MAKKKNHYIDKHEFHAEMTLCKFNDTISNKAIEFFYELARNKSRVHTFQDPADYEDAISCAVMDCYKYWRNFKEGRVVKLPLLRNFQKGDKLVVKIGKFGNVTIKPGVTFEIDENINRSMINMINGHEFRTKSSCFMESKSLGVYVDRTRRSVTMMDVHNRKDLEIASSLEIHNHKSSPLVKTKKGEGREAITVIEFMKPPNAFNYFTSVVTNGFYKFNNEANPKNKREYKTISMSEINKNANGFFNV